MTGVQTCALPICFPVTIFYASNHDVLPHDAKEEVGWVLFLPFDYLSSTQHHNSDHALRWLVAFFSFNQERGIDLGSPWYATSLLGFDLTKYVSPNLVTLLLILAALLSAWRIWSKKIRLGEPIDSQSASDS